jgi:hypothetical protein
MVVELTMPGSDGVPKRDIVGFSTRKAVFSSTKIVTKDSWFPEATIT